MNVFNVNTNTNHNYFVTRHTSQGESEASESSNLIQICQNALLNGAIQYIVNIAPKREKKKQKKVRAAHYVISKTLNFASFNQLGKFLDLLGSIA